MRDSTAHDQTPIATFGTSARAARWALILPAALILAIMVVPSSVMGSPTTAGSAPLPVEVREWSAISGSWVLPGLTLGSPLAPTANVAGSLQFAQTNPTGAANVAQAVNQPGSPVYRQYLSTAAYDSLFGPDSAQQTGLMSDLQSQGLTVSIVSPFLWNVRGPASSMDAVFDTTFVHAVAADGRTGWAPDSPLHLPSDLATGVTAVGAFQNAQSAAHTDNIMVPHRHGAPRAESAPRSGVTLGLNISTAFAENYTGPWITYAPTGVNVTYTLTIVNGTGPYTVEWNWGDGTNQTFTTANGYLNASHMYYNPGQTDYCFNTFTYTCENITVWAYDGSSDWGNTTLGVVPVGGPAQAQTFYNDVTLFKLGYSGAGTKIGLDEECDPSYPTAQYMIDINNFSAAFGLPLMTTSTLQLVGSGNSDANCNNNGGGAYGWSGETLLDMEWSHAFAPNATLVVDLSASAIDEGDVAWDALSQGVFVDSNSWGCPYWDNNSGCDYTWQPWEEAAAQGQSYLTASGDCGAGGMSGTDPPTDTSFGLGVGATDYYPNPAGTFHAEFAWNGTNLSTAQQCNEGDNDDGSTGGYASGGQGNASIPAPWYQIGMTGFTGDYRGVPDVAALGGTWVEQYYYGGWGPTAGTSLASPSYAAMLDMVYDYNNTASRSNGFIDNSIYLIAKSPDYNLALHDITVGNNLVDGVGYYTNVGWSPVTGLGSPNIANLAMIMSNRDANACGVSGLTVVASANASWGPSGLAVYFGADVAGGGNDLFTGYTYDWNFGDGSLDDSGAVSTATHVYTASGWYPATVTVTEGGETSTSTPLLIHVTGAGSVVEPLVATASASTTAGVGPLTVDFTGGSQGGSATPITYNWSFGDGAYSNSQNPSHDYTAYGAFTAQLTVFQGVAQSVADVAINVCHTLLTTTATGSPLVGLAPLNVSFSASPTGEVGAVTYGWTFGDGAETSADATPSHVYNSTGSFVANVTVTDSLGRTALAHVTVDVTGYEPLAITAHSNVTSGDTPLAVAFTSTVSGGKGPYTYAWNFNSQGTSSVADPDHTFTTAGKLVVELTVSDSLSHVAYAWANVTATTIPALTVSMVGNLVPVAGTPAGYWASATGGVPGSGYSYTWTWGDGTAATTTTVNNSAHTFASAATDTVTVTVKDSVGHTASASLAVSVSAAPSNSNSSNGILGLPVDIWVALIVVIVVLVVIVAVAMGRRKKSPPPGETPPGWQGGGYGQPGGHGQPGGYGQAPPGEQSYPPGMAPPR